MTAVKVALREKKISEGRYSLYLDFYPPVERNGKTTRREFINMYRFAEKKELKTDIDKLKIRISARKSEGKETEAQEAELSELQSFYKDFKGLTPIDRKHNTETVGIAEAIRQKRENELNKPEIYSDYEREQLRKKALGDRCFVTYFREMADKRTGANYRRWDSAVKFFENYAGESFKFNQLSESFLEAYKEHLLTTKTMRSDKFTLSRNSAAMYFTNVKTALRQAYIEGILQVDLNARVKPIKMKEARREYLSLEELGALAKTPCSDHALRKAALFSALTGLRFSDIEKLTWKEVIDVSGQPYLKFTQKKTKGEELLPISDQALDLCGDRREPNDKVFRGLIYSAYRNKLLTDWLKAAGITRDITFHCFRHTYATLQLSNGTDIYTVSKMLGHKDLKTTQIYAKIVDEKKIEAANKIKIDF